MTERHALYSTKSIQASLSMLVYKHTNRGHIFTSTVPIRCSIHLNNLPVAHWGRLCVDEWVGSPVILFLCQLRTQAFSRMIVLKKWLDWRKWLIPYNWHPFLLFACGWTLVKIIVRNGGHARGFFPSWNSAKTNQRKITNSTLFLFDYYHNNSEIA